MHDFVRGLRADGFVFYDGILDPGACLCLLRSHLSSDSVVNVDTQVRLRQHGLGPMLL